MDAGTAPPGKPAFSWPEGKRFAISLTFDDARPSQLDYGIPLFDRLGVHATFYLTLAAVDWRLDDWRKAIAAGHEGGGHTMTHPCSINFGFTTNRRSMLEEMTLDEMEAELLESNAGIRERLGVTPRGFAYPCGQKFVGRGEQLRSYVPLVARHYLTGRGWRDEYLNRPDRCDLAQLSGIAFDDTAFDSVRSRLDKARNQGAWLVFAGHDIGPTGGAQTTTLATLESLCRYALDPANGAWIDTVGTIGAYIQRMRDADA